MTPIDVSAGTPGRKIKAIKPGYFGTAIAITPDGRTAYVTACFESDSTVESDMPGMGPGTVTAIKTATGTRGKPIRVGSHPDAIALTRS